MRPLGWVLLTVTWVGIITALTFCLGRVMRAETVDGKARKRGAKSD